MCPPQELETQRSMCKHVGLCRILWPPRPTPRVFIQMTLLNHQDPSPWSYTHAELMRQPNTHQWVFEVPGIGKEGVRGEPTLCGCDLFVETVGAGGIHSPTDAYLCLCTVYTHSSHWIRVEEMICAKLVEHLEALLDHHPTHPSPLSTG